MQHMHWEGINYHFHNMLPHYEVATSGLDSKDSTEPKEHGLGLVITMGWDIEVSPLDGGCVSYTHFKLSL